MESLRVCALWLYHKKNESSIVKISYSIASFLYVSYSVVLKSCVLCARVRCERVHVGKGLGLTVIAVRVLVSAPIDGPSSQPTDTMDHGSTVAMSALRCSLIRAAAACVSSPMAWAVSIGPHMQLDMVISQAPPRLGARLATNMAPTIGDLHCETVVRGEGFSSCFLPPGRPALKQHWEGDHQPVENGPDL